MGTSCLWWQPHSIWEASIILSMNFEPTLWLGIWTPHLQKSNPCIHVSLFIYKYFFFVYKESSKIKRIKIFISCPKCLKPLTFETVGSSQNFLKWRDFLPASTLWIWHTSGWFYEQKRGLNGLKHTQHQGWYESFEFTRMYHGEQAWSSIWKSAPVY